jgi:hypothetical protein
MGNLVKSKNIMARINGTSNNSKALLLLSLITTVPHIPTHMVQAMPAGVATILECSCLLYTKKPHKNDIIIPFSDAEELGLNGAALL